MVGAATVGGLVGLYVFVTPEDLATGGVYVGQSLSGRHYVAVGGPGERMRVVAELESASLAATLAGLIRVSARAGSRTRKSKARPTGGTCEPSPTAKSRGRTGRTRSR